MRFTLLLVPDPYPAPPVDIYKKALSKPNPSTGKMEASPLAVTLAGSLAGARSRRIGNFPGWNHFEPMAALPDLRAPFFSDGSETPSPSIAPLLYSQE